MAGIVQLDFKATEACDCKSITFKELTSAYDSNLNIGGWGTPNYALADVLDVQLLIKVPDGTVYTLDAATIGSLLPNDALGVFPIHMGLLGGTARATMTQGLYQIEYYVLIDDGSTTGLEIRKRKWTMVYCTIKCCVHKMLLALDMCDDCPCSEEKSNALEAYTLYKAMLYASACGSTEKAAKLLKQVNKLCSYQSTCKSCS